MQPTLGNCNLTPKLDTEQIFCVSNVKISYRPTDAGVNSSIDNMVDRRKPAEGFRDSRFVSYVGSRSSDRQRRIGVLPFQESNRLVNTGGRKSYHMYVGPEG